jgi:hypothetical protein
MSPLADLIKKLTGKKGFLAGKAKPITAPGAVNPNWNPLAPDDDIYPGPSQGVQGFVGPPGYQGWQGSVGLQGLGNQGQYSPQAVQVSVSSAPVNGVREVTLTAEGLGKKISIQGFGVLVWDGKEWRLDGKKAGETVSGPIGELGNRVISF